VDGKPLKIKKTKVTRIKNELRHTGTTSETIKSNTTLRAKSRFVGQDTKDVGFN
jgi:hypothetical protein